MIGLHIQADSDRQHWPGEIFEMARNFKLEAIAFVDQRSVGSVTGRIVRVS